MSNSSDLQMSIFAAYATFAGLGLMISPATVLTILSPMSNLVESLTGLPSAAVDSNMIKPTGALAAAIGLYYVLAIYTKDEKFKKNTVPGRIIFGINCIAGCFIGTGGSSFLFLLGVTDLIAAAFMGYTVGFTAFLSSSEEKRD